MNNNKQVLVDHLKEDLVDFRDLRVSMTNSEEQVVDKRLVIHLLIYLKVLNRCLEVVARLEVVQEEKEDKEEKDQILL
jgi:hypothetical protein